jgi:CHAD domain-containing protein
MMLDIGHTGSHERRIKNPERSILPDEPLPLALQRITVGLLGRAIDDLRGSNDRTFDASVHSARKNLKQLRGRIRLVRDEVGYRTYREENVVLRDTSRTLSGMRDAWVLVKTLSRLRKHYADLLDEATFETPKEWLTRRHEQRRRVVSRSVIHHAVVSLGTARARYAKYPMADVIDDDFSSVAPGVHRVYRRGLRGFQRGVETRGVEDLHEWRKRVKYLRYQMESFRPMQPTLIGALVKELESLGEILGDEHDLAVLAETILEHPESCGDERERWMLIALIHERRANLQAQAFRSGAALYTEGPDAFVDRIAAYWESGRR